jgi:hypothetical protein
MVPRSRSYKKESKENVSNVLKEAHPLTQAQIHLPFSFHFQIPEIRSPRSHSYKKEGKKNVSNTFLEKPHPFTHHPKVQLTYQQRSRSPVVPRSRSYKKRRKRTLVMFFLKKNPYPRNLPFQILLLWILQRRGREKGGKRVCENVRV